MKDPVEEIFFAQCQVSRIIQIYNNDWILLTNLQGDAELRPVVLPKYESEEKVLTRREDKPASIPISMPFKRSASADPEGLALSVNLPFEMLRRRYVQ